MTKEFVFVGNPGPNAPEMLETLKTWGLTPKRLLPTDDLPVKISSGQPATVMFGSDVTHLGSLVMALREKPTLTSVPMLASVSKIDSDFLNAAFRCGVDDFILEGAIKQFEVLVATLQKNDSWRAVRAPAGQVILAHGDRIERVRLGRVLKRNGFDTFFTASTEELGKAMDRVAARAVIVSSKLKGQFPLNEIISKAGERSGGDQVPWVMMVSADEADKLRASLPDSPEITLFETGADAEGLTFVMNELLAPPPEGVRKSPRILYGVPVSFVHQGGRVPFYGFTFNINLGGLYIRTLSPLPLQTRIIVTFRPPFGRGHVVATAQVVWCKKLGDTGGAASPPGMGVQFIDMWQADKAGFDVGYNILLGETQDNPMLTLGPGPAT
ncbi:MAG: hypothetical protein GY847_41045 [Proteobacteria bacterium]|nr:hypothetical protein [Pseudomonadota bacterium]